MRGAFFEFPNEKNMFGCFPQRNRGLLAERTKKIKETKGSEERRTNRGKKRTRQFRKLSQTATRQGVVRRLRTFGGVEVVFKGGFGFKLALLLPTNFGK